MTQLQPQPSPRLPPEQLSALWRACDSNNIAPLAQLIETLNPPADDLMPGLMVAIERGHLSMIRYLLERGMSITGSIVRVALEVRSIPVLEILREFGWDVNMKLAKMEGRH
jgi:ankyrin repeat protein